MRLGGLVLGLLLALASAEGFAAQVRAPKGGGRGWDAEVERLFAENRFAEAEAVLERVLVDEPSAEARYLLGVCRVQRWDYAGAEALFDAATEAEPQRDEWLFTLAKVRHEQGSYVAAIEALDRAIALKPRAEYRYWKGLCAQRAGRVADAEVELRLALERRPNHADSLYRLGALLGDRGELAESRALLERALTAQPGHVDARFRLGLARVAAGELEPALATFDAVLAAVPSHLGALYNRGRLLVRLGRADEGRAVLEDFRARCAVEDEIKYLLGLVNQTPAATERRLVLARHLLTVGRVDDARQQAELARFFSPGEPDVHRLLSDVLRLEGDLDGSRAAAAEAERLSKTARDAALKDAATPPAENGATPPARERARQPGERP